jgi:hypothetical protein
MNLQGLKKSAWFCGSVATGALLAGSLAATAQPGRSTLILTSSNDPSTNNVLVFKLNTGQAPSLTLASTLPTGGKGGASGNAGILQFKDNFGAVANFASNSVTQLARFGNTIGVRRTIDLASQCTGPDSVALAHDNLFIVGANCAESHNWPSGSITGSVVNLTDKTAAQIVAGRTWAAVTMGSGSVLRLPLSNDKALDGSSTTITLPSNADNTPLGADFWGDILGFNPAHSADSFALIDASENVYPVLGPDPPYPVNAPCWLVKGPHSLWYSGNSPGKAISIFFSDDKGGAFYKSIPLPGSPTDITVSPDGNWLAVIYTAGDGAHIAVYSIDKFGDLAPAATSPAVGVASFSGVAFSQ